MKRFTDEFLEKIKQINIQDLLANVYKLPEDKEKTCKAYPVFNSNSGEKIIINAGKNTFFISSGEARGNIINLVMYLDNLDFVNAVKKNSKYLQHRNKQCK